MANPTPTLLTSGTAGSGTSAGTASVSPTGNYLILAALSLRWTNSQSTPTITVSGNGLTWVQVAEENGTAGSSEWSLHVFRALGASPSSGAITFSSGSENVIAWNWDVIEWSDVDTSGTNGSGAIAQSATNFGTSPLTVTLASGDSGNSTFGAFAENDYDNPTYTPGTGFTEISDGSSGFASLQTEWQSGIDTSVDATCSTSSAPMLGIAIEVKAAAGGSTAVPVFYHNLQIQGIA